MNGSYRINYVFLVFESEPHECQHLDGEMARGLHKIAGDK